MVSSPRPPAPKFPERRRRTHNPNPFCIADATHASEHHSVRYWSEETNAMTTGEVVSTASRFASPTVPPRWSSR